jgi:hypothetical protein
MMLSAPWLLQYPPIMADNDCVCANEQRRLAFICVVDFTAVHILHLRCGSLEDVVEGTQVVREILGELRRDYLNPGKPQLGKKLLPSR